MLQNIGDIFITHKKIFEKCIQNIFNFTHTTHTHSEKYNMTIY